MVRHCADDGDSGAPAARALAASTACGRETADYIYHTFPTIRLHEEPSIIFSKRRARTEARQGRSDFCARNRVRETFSLPSSGRACWIGDFRFVFVFRFCFLMFVYQAKILQYCFYHKPLKNSTVLHSPLPRQISTVYAQNRPQVETVSHCTYPSRVKSLEYIRRPPSYKQHQQLSSFPACLGKHPFSPFA